MRKATATAASAAMLQFSAISLGPMWASSGFNIPTPAMASSSSLLEVSCKSGLNIRRKKFAGVLVSTDVQEFFWFGPLALLDSKELELAHRDSELLC